MPRKRTKPPATNPEQIRAKLEHHLLKALTAKNPSASILTEARRYFQQREREDPFAVTPEAAPQHDPSVYQGKLLDHLARCLDAKGITSLPFGHPTSHSVG